jgi:hypothetical protein
MEAQHQVLEEDLYWASVLGLISFNTLKETLIMGNKNSTTTKKILVLGQPGVGKSFIIDFIAFGDSFVSIPTKWIYSQTVQIDRHTHLEMREYAKIDSDVIQSNWDGVILVVKASATKEDILQSKNKLIQCWQDKPVCIIQNEIFKEKPRYSFEQINDILQIRALPGRVLATRFDFSADINECHQKVIKICRFFQGV